MKASGWIAGLSGIVLVGLLGACLPAQEAQLLPPQPQPAVVQVSFEVATRGPLHEAFAKPFSSDPVAGVTIDVAPPEPIEELPPEVAPAGENVEWVPGYWGWEPDRETFIWISGIWRNAPPGQQWVPGYWTEVDGQYQWVSGFWTREDTQAIVYLPYPPESLEQGPDSAPPDGDYFWVPGTWLWVGNEYQWKPGYWAQAYESWVWNPSEYVWTPYGCIYTAGYWDYRPTNRGIVFAPVYIRPAVARTRIVRYTPSVIVQVPRTLVHWFVSPQYHHYYYGNYYGRTYGQMNLMPWYTYQARPGYHDPLLNYYRWHYARRNVDFVDRLARWHRYYALYEDRRPPVTFAQQREVFGRLGEDATAGHFRLAQSIDEAVAERDPERRFRRLERERRQQLAQAAETMREVQQLRDRVERMTAQQPGEQRGLQQGVQQRLRRLELPDEARTALRLSPDRGDQQPRIADGGRPDGRADRARDGRERPRGPEVAQDRAESREDAEDTRRPPERDDQQPFRAARPVTPDEADGDEAGREQPAPDQQPPTRRPERPDQETQEAPPALQPPAAPQQEQRAQQRPGQLPEQAAGRGRPGQPPAARLPAGQRGERPDVAQPAPPEGAEDARARQQAVPQRGQARGFDGRNLRVPGQVRPEEAPEDAARGQRGPADRRYPPFNARRGPQAQPEPQGERRDQPGRPTRGLGPLDQQPPEIDRDDRRGRGPARADRARGAARGAQPGPPPGRGPAADEADRNDDRRGPPQRAGRGRPERGESDQPQEQPQAEEPDDDESDE